MNAHLDTRDVNMRSALCAFGGGFMLAFTTNIIVWCLRWTQWAKKTVSSVMGCQLHSYLMGHYDVNKI